MKPYTGYKEQFHINLIKFKKSEINSKKNVMLIYKSVFYWLILIGYSQLNESDTIALILIMECYRNRWTLWIWINSVNQTDSRTSLNSVALIWKLQETLFAVVFWKWKQILKMIFQILLKHRKKYKLNYDIQVYNRWKNIVIIYW